MSIVAQRPTSAADVVAAVTALAPSIAARAVEIEAARRLTADVLDDLKVAGVFRLLLPPSHGGLGADVVDLMNVLEILAAADGSTGWTAMIGAGGWIDLAGLPRATFDAIFDGSDIVTAGVIAPTGSIVQVSGGYSVSGRWAFVSGCEHADVIYLDCIEGVTGDAPQLRIAVLSPEDVVIEDTWDVSGLRGTGSHHVQVNSVVVPAERTLDPLGAEPCIDATVAHIPPASLLSCIVASISVGIAAGALADVVELARTKVPMLDHVPLAANPTFQLELATADTELRAARGVLREAATSLWATAVAGAEPTLTERARVRAGSVWATGRARAVVDAAYRAGGGSSLYSGCALQRRLRDIHAVTQHFLVRPDTMTTAGDILAGNEPDLLLF